MKYRLLFVLILVVLLGFTATLFAEQPVFLGHFGRINDLVYDAQRGLLFSAGDDGTVRIWNPEQRRLLGVVRVSHKPVRQIAVHPTEPHVAVLVGVWVDVGVLVGVLVQVWVAVLMGVLVRVYVRVLVTVLVMV